MEVKMKPKHSNPTQSRVDRDRKAYNAKAPYNFIPLAEKIVTSKETLKHDKFEGLTGFIDCQLETCSPTYIRSIYTEVQYSKFGRVNIENLSNEDKEALKNEIAGFFSTKKIQIGNRLVPVIPGSSIRGMIRSVVEIVGYGRIRWVADSPTFTFRAVAAAKDDPLRQPYVDALGPFGRHVRAGFLVKNGDLWKIKPASTPEEMGWPERNAYLKVKENQIGSDAIENYIRINSPNYRPQVHRVSFNIRFGTGVRGRYVSVNQISSDRGEYPYKGTLVCSGNMLETAPKGQKSPRKNHALIIELENSNGLLDIDDQAIKDYKKGMTTFQENELTDWGGKEAPGCLADNAPVFYVAEGNKVIYFGHSPNFRIPARLFTQNRASTPQDFIGPNHSSVRDPDLAEAIFGWTEDKDWGPTGQFAGKVYFSDAQFIEAKNGLWLNEKPIILHTLASPKPTTFQHYLVQDKSQGHNPDDKVSLAHYGTPKNETEIRGHKLYWHKGDTPDIEATTKEREHESQLTKVIPLKPGVKFSFRINFENLRDEELGALLWALTLPGNPNETYRHKLGMGKPLGMGAVAIKTNLFIGDRKKRYQHLFNNDIWNIPLQEASIENYIKEFEKFVLNQIAPQKKKLLEVERIQCLFTMLKWQEGDSEWLEKTRYMEIEHGPEKTNEFKERPVLPDPLFVCGKKVKADQQEPDIKKATTEKWRHGTVKKFMGSFGFIKPDDGDKDIFVHINNLSDELFTLVPGARVIFRVAQGKKGLEAVDVQSEQGK